MRLLSIAAAALIATGIAAAPSVEAQPGPGWHGGPHRHWDRPPPRRWHHHGPRCRVVWRHHHRERRCW
jgi:hypothetical protein